MCWFLRFSMRVHTCPGVEVIVAYYVSGKDSGAYYISRFFCLVHHCSNYREELKWIKNQP